MGKCGIDTNHWGSQELDENYWAIPRFPYSLDSQRGKCNKIMGKHHIPISQDCSNTSEVCVRCFFSSNPQPHPIHWVPLLFQGSWVARWPWAPSNCPRHPLLAVPGARAAHPAAHPAEPGAPWASAGCPGHLCRGLLRPFTGSLTINNWNFIWISLGFHRDIIYNDVIGYVYIYICIQTVYSI